MRSLFSHEKKTTIDSLNAEEQHLAARTSYAYWYLEEETDSPPSADMQRLAALREVRRHLVASDGDLKKTIERVKTVCEYRKVRYTTVSATPCWLLDDMLQMSENLFLTPNELYLGTPTGLVANRFFRRRRLRQLCQ
jgi:hypothetical protein